MPYQLLRNLLPRRRPARLLARDDALPSSCDVVVIGGGGHGLACAYYLAREHGIRDVCVLERGWLGGGNTARNTTIIRSNYLTPDGVRFYDASLKLFANLSQELDFNLFYATRGHYTLAHTDAALRTLRWRAEVNRHLGVASEVVDADAVRRGIPGIDLDCGGRAPAVLGALYHAPGATARHDAVAWGYARAAQRLGVRIFQQTAVQGVDIAAGRVCAVHTTRGRIATGNVVSAVAGATPGIAAMAGLSTPIVVHPLQAMVSEPLKPWLDPIVVSASLHVYVSQSARGELVMGAALDPYELHATRSTLGFTQHLSAHMLDLFPFLGPVKVLRQWAGMADMTPDFAPIMGRTPVDGFHLDAGWGTWGFKATPIAGRTMAWTVANGRDHALIEPFSLARFANFRLTGEKGAASVGH